MQALDALAQALPSNQVFPVALEYSQSHIASADAEERRSACDVMVVMAEGCSKLVRKHLNAVLKVSPFCRFSLHLHYQGARCVLFHKSRHTAFFEIPGTI